MNCPRDVNMRAGLLDSRTPAAMSVATRPMVNGEDIFLLPFDIIFKCSRYFGCHGAKKTAATCQIQYSYEHTRKIDCNTETGSERRELTIKHDLTLQGLFGPKTGIYSCNLCASIGKSSALPNGSMLIKQSQRVHYSIVKETQKIRP